MGANARAATKRTAIRGRIKRAAFTAAGWEAARIAWAPAFFRMALDMNHAGIRGSTHIFHPCSRATVEPVLLGIQHYCSGAVPCSGIQAVHLRGASLSPSNTGCALGSSWS